MPVDILTTKRKSICLERIQVREHIWNKENSFRLQFLVVQGVQLYTSTRAQRDSLLFWNGLPEVLEFVFACLHMKHSLLLLGQVLGNSGSEKKRKKTI